MQALKPIKTETEYKNALKALGVFFDNNPDNADQDTADYFEVLATLVERYEQEHYPIDPPDPIEAIKFPCLRSIKRQTPFKFGND